MDNDPAAVTCGPWKYALLLDPCVYCYAPSNGLDHIRPRATGGLDGWENRAPACAVCDNAKGALPLLLFLLTRGIAERPQPSRATRMKAEEPTSPVLSFSLAVKLSALGFTPLE